MTPPPEDLTRFTTGAESARTDVGEDLTALPTGAESAGDTRGMPASSGGSVSVADFEIVRELGRGGMGVVHLARHRRVRSRWFAIKTLLPDRTADAGFLKRFQRESSVLYGLRHTHIVVLHGASRPDEPPLMILEYVPGPIAADSRNHLGWAVDWPNPPLNLHDLTVRDGKLPPHRVADIGAKLASALQAVHDRGLVHRDVKPQNVLLDTSGDPVLADFGLTRDIDPESLRLTGSMDNLGTIGYVAPEVKRDPAAATPAADQFSLAVTLYVIATGDDPDVIRPEAVPSRLYPVLSRALNKNPNERYPSVSDFGAALAKLRPAGVSTTGGDVAVNVCPECGTVNKDTDLLCAKCGKGITTPCLKCYEATPVSRPACIKCGAVQAEIFETIKKDVDERLASAAKSRREFRFQAVMDTLRPLVSLAHPRLTDFAERAKSELKTARGEWAEWQKKIDGAVAAAWPNYAAGQYSGLASRFSGIPTALWTPRMTLIAADAKKAPVLQHQATAELIGMLAQHNQAYIPLDAEKAAEKFDLHKLFKRYAKKIRHHSQNDLADSLAVKDAWMHFSRFAKLTSLYEARESFWQVQPYSGPPIALQSIPRTEIDPWGYSLPLPDEMKSTSTEYSLPDTQRIIDCTACRASGSVVCGECGGRKMAKCKPCDGTKMVKCSNCNGRGREERTRRVRRYRDCPRCRGSGRVGELRCGKCDGTGRAEFQDEEVYTVPCEACVERGRVNCRACGATGEVPCQTCRTTGMVVCTTCMGKRQLVEVGVVKQKFWTADNVSATTQPSMTPGIRNRLDTGRDYAQVASVQTPELAPFPIELPGAEMSELTELVRGLLFAALPQDTKARLVRQEVSLFAASAYQFSYRRKKKEYDCWIDPGEGALFAPINPITNELEQMVQEALKSESDRAIALAVRDAREMAEDDDFCAEALERVKSDVPKKIWTWSKTVMTEEKRNFYMLGGGLCAFGFLLLLLGLFTHIAVLGFGVLVGLGGAGVIAYGSTKSR